MKNNQTNQTPQKNSGANSESINGKNSTKLSKLSVSELETISGGRVYLFRNSRVKKELEFRTSKDYGYA
ncbi:hypothetical protein BJP36_17985 [Moorena producens JHB]|uniref:Uncharacterized protein n=1 Tax=Moorena producens (strain JHB) TaxID=1454205 RepID=A0A1D9G1L9_MOOP1|nr:hypothetical protein [Moorena producens]AOY81519.1 hypothetical protein BJP36_17985 [Moorena producens JHB]